jgi:hypothetical protein
MKREFKPGEEVGFKYKRRYCIGMVSKVFVYILEVDIINGRKGFRVNKKKVINKMRELFA